MQKREPPKRDRDRETADRLVERYADHNPLGELGDGIYRALRRVRREAYSNGLVDGHNLATAEANPTTSRCEKPTKRKVRK